MSSLPARYQRSLCSKPQAECSACFGRGQPYLDGSVTDFIYYDNSHLLKCEGAAFILDYTQARAFL